MSGSTGNEKIQSRDTFDLIHKSYSEFIEAYPLLQSVEITGSYNSDTEKKEFGDMDLVVNLDYTKDEKLVEVIGEAISKNSETKKPKEEATVTKGAVKEHFIEWLANNNDGCIVPFLTNGELFGNPGEMVTISYQVDKDTPACQIDNMVALSVDEAEFKKQFLDFPADKQGLMLGLVKTVMQEDGIKKVFDRIDVTLETELPEGTEYEFNLSSKELTLRKIEYDVEQYKNGKFEELSRTSMQTWKDFKILDNLLGEEYVINSTFEELIEIADAKLKNPRSRGRALGVFKSMISVKKGEAGKAKGDAKTKAIELMEKTFGTKTIEESVYSLAGRMINL
jgi:hypothetical protein